MKISAIVVTYNPIFDDLLRNIDSYLNQVNYLIIWQNSKLTDLELKKIYTKSPKSIIILGTGENVGIGIALNESIKWSIDHGCDYVLTLDQDSHFKEGMLNRYKCLIQQTDYPGVGIYGVNPNNWNHQLYDTKEPTIEVADTITSGSIFPVSVFIQYGFFDEELFIDAVDYEFCYRLKSKGVKTIVFTSIILEHEVGEAHKTWIGFKTDNYSAFRTYFIVRNHIAIWKRYPSIFPYNYKYVLIKTHILSRILKIILAEKDKLNKLKSIKNGLIDGLKGKTGMYRN